MPLQCGIVGLPNVGKSTLFNALTSAKALAANYPFATKEPNIGMITVPDIRLDKLSEIVKPQRILPTTVEIVDIAGLIKGASKGEGLGNQFLSTIREVDAIVHVVRCFIDDNIVHVDGGVDPLRDKMVIDNELILKDLETIEKRIDKQKKQAKSGSKEDQRRVELLEELFKYLEDGNAARGFKISEEDLAFFKDIYLLTAKPVLYVCNVDESSVLHGNDLTAKFRELVKGEKAEVILICAGIEAEIAELESKEERMEFVKDMGLEEQATYNKNRASKYVTTSAQPGLKIKK